MKSRCYAKIIQGTTHCELVVGPWFTTVYVREDIMTTFIVDNNKFKAINLANWATTRQTFAVNMLVYICECMNHVRIILCWHDEGEGGNNKNTAYLMSKVCQQTPAALTLLSLWPIKIPNQTLELGPPVQKCDTLRLNTCFIVEHRKTRLKHQQPLLSHDTLLPQFRIIFQGRHAHSPLFEELISGA